MNREDLSSLVPSKGHVNDFQLIAEILICLALVVLCIITSRFVTDIQVKKSEAIRASYEDCVR